jgi:hypothetical protein
MTQGANRFSPDSYLLWAGDNIFTQPRNKDVAISALMYPQLLAFWCQEVMDVLVVQLWADAGKLRRFVVHTKSVSRAQLREPTCSRM